MSLDDAPEFGPVTWNDAWASRWKPRGAGVPPIYASDLVDGATITLYGHRYDVIHHLDQNERCIILRCREFRDASLFVRLVERPERATLVVVTPTKSFAGESWVELLYDDWTVRFALLKAMEPYIKNVKHLSVVYPQDSLEALDAAYHLLDSGQGFTVINEMSDVLNKTPRAWHDHWSEISDQVTTVPEMAKRLGLEFKSAAVAGQHINFCQLEFERRE